MAACMKHRVDDVHGAARELAHLIVLLVNGQVDTRLDRLALLLALAASGDGCGHGRRQVAEATDVGERLLRLAVLLLARGRRRRSRAHDTGHNNLKAPSVPTTFVEEGERRRQVANSDNRYEM